MPMKNISRGLNVIIGDHEMKKKLYQIEIEKRKNVLNAL